MPQSNPVITTANPAASPIEAAAIAAALSRFLSDNAPAAAPTTVQQSPWLSAALSEGVSRQPQLPASWVSVG